MYTQTVGHNLIQIKLKKQLLLLTFLLSSELILGQDFCVTNTNSSAVNYTSLSRMQYANSSNEETLCLNVYFHIVRNDNGSGGIPSYETNLIVDNLNLDFNSFNISFNKIGHDYIDNSNLNNIESGSEELHLFLLIMFQMLSTFILLTMHSLEGHQLVFQVKT